MEKRKFTSSGPKDYVVRSVNGLTASLFLRTRRRSKNKQKARNATTDDAFQKFVEILEEFKDVPCPGYSMKQEKKQPNESYYFLVKQVSKLLKINKQVLLHTQKFK